MKDPILRENTKDNTPGIIHYKIVPGDQVKIKVAPKGFGSENMSRVFMLKPADGIEGVKEAVLTAVKDAGSTRLESDRADLGEVQPRWLSMSTLIRLILPDFR